METSTYSNVTTGRTVYGILDVAESTRYRSIWSYGAPTVIILGTIGNILSALVMNRKSLRASTTSLYLTVLAVADLFCLYMTLLPQWIQYTFGVAIGFLPNIGCTTYWAVVLFAIHFEAWVLVSVSLERFVAVWFPTKHKILFTKPRAIAGLLVLLVLFVGETAHFHFTFNTIDCHINEKYLYFLSYIYPVLDLALASLLPFVVIGVTSLAIILKLLKNKKKLQKAKVSSMTVILISISAAFFVTTSPICFCIILLPHLLDNNVVSQETFHTYVNLWAWLNLLFYMNYTVNFILYCVTGKRFRRELLMLIGMKNRIQPSSSEMSRNTVSVEA